jgi:hypothetical protein
MNFCKITILVLLTVIVLIKGNDYFISFSLTNLNLKEINYQINISKALTIKHNGKDKFLFKLWCNNKKLRQCLKKNSSKIFNILLTENIIVTSFSQISNSSFFEKTKIVYLPKRFDIIIKNGYAYFYLKEEK